MWTETKARKKTDHFKTAQWKGIRYCESAPLPSLSSREASCPTHGSLRFCNIDTSQPQAIQEPPPTFSNPRLHGIELCVIDAVGYPAGILDCFCYGPDGLAPLLLSCSLIVT